jgi:hypothetical protein
MVWRAHEVLCLQAHTSRVGDKRDGAEDCDGEES